MKLKKLGKSSSKVLINISTHGLWLIANQKEYFVPHDRYPDFKNAKLSDIYNVQLLNEFHLYWPNLDMDIDIKALEEPEKYPLIYRKAKQIKNAS